MSIVGAVVRYGATLCAAACVLGCATVAPDDSPAGQWTQVRPGLLYAKRSPLPDSVVHVVRADLTVVRLTMSASEERGRTVDAMTGSQGSAVSVNASFFDRSYQPRGITVTNGEDWLPVHAAQSSPVFACDRAQRCEIQLMPPTAPAPHWYNAVAGTPWLLDQGRQRTAKDDASCKNLCETLHPRTAVGLDASRRYLYIVTAEGRKPPVLGLSLVQLSGIMANLGVVDALNLDGGGSSALFVQGASVMARPANEPQQRRVANAIHVLAP